MPRKNNTRRQNTRRQNTRKRNSSRHNTRRKNNTRKHNTRKRNTRRQNTRRKNYSRIKNKYAGGSGAEQVATGITIVQMLFELMYQCYRRNMDKTTNIFWDGRGPGPGGPPKFKRFDLNLDEGAEIFNEEWIRHNIGDDDIFPREMMTHPEKLDKIIKLWERVSPYFGSDNSCRSTTIPLYLLDGLTFFLMSKGIQLPGDDTPSLFATKTLEYCGYGRIDAMQADLVQ
jgi:hypothetical protein